VLYVLILKTRMSNVKWGKYVGWWKRRKGDVRVGDESKWEMNVRRGKEILGWKDVR